MATLLTVTIVGEAPREALPVPALDSEIVKPVVPTGTIEVRIGRAVIKVDGVVDTEMLRTVLGSLRP